MLTKSKWLVSVISVSLAAVALAAAGPGYHVMKTYKVGGEGGWDYLTADADARRVYISRGTHVMVIDADSGKSVGDIADTPGVHGIALGAGTGPRIYQQRAGRHRQYFRYQDSGHQQQG